MGIVYTKLVMHLRGWTIESEDGVNWYYSDDKRSIKIERPCIRCGRMPTPEGYDAYCGYQKDKKSVCCGHGIHKPISI